MDNEKSYGKIDRYLNNEMTEAERHSFEARINADEKLAEEVSLHKALLKTTLLDDKHAQDFIRLNHQIHEDASKREGQIKPEKEATSAAGNGRSTFRIISIALASAAAIALLIMFIFGQQDLYNKYHPSKDISLASHRGNDQASLEDLRKSFQSENYEKTLMLCESYLQDKELNEYYEVLLIQGVAYLELGDFEKAVHTFTVYENAKIKSAIKGTWFKALAYLKNGDMELCKSALHKVIEKNQHKAKKAKDLLSELE